MHFLSISWRNAVLPALILALLLTRGSSSLACRGEHFPETAEAISESNESPASDAPAVSSFPTSGGARGLGTYHDDFEKLKRELREQYAEIFPTIAQLQTIGTSVDGREILAMKITDFPDDAEDEPEFAYISTMHGDEYLGTELCLYLIHELLTRYDDDARIANLVNETEIWIIPLMNPDGRERNRRENTNNKDLNRDFFPDTPPTQFGTIYDGPAIDAAGRQPETIAIAEWAAERNIVLSANLHTKALVVAYPYGNDGGGCTGKGAYTATPDDLLFRHLSLIYANNHSQMRTTPNPLGSIAPGIINGSEWFRVCGEMQDWQYRYLGSLAVTLELYSSTAAVPPEADIVNHWNLYNKEAMLDYLEAVHIGVRGLVRNATNDDPVWAKIRVVGNDREVYTDPDVGDFHRLLLPGTYSFTVSATGYQPRTIDDVVVTDGPATRVDVDLEPLYAIIATSTMTALPSEEHRWLLEIQVNIDVDQANQPPELMARETLPLFWQYLPGSSSVNGVVQGDPVLDGATAIWEFSGNGVGDLELRYRIASEDAPPGLVIIAGEIVVVPVRTVTVASSVFTVPASVHLVLRRGWNLLSLPLDLTGMTIDQVFSPTNLVNGATTTDNTLYRGAAWGWDGDSFRVMDSLEAAPVFWIWIANSGELVVPGPPAAPSSISLPAGWRLFAPLAVVSNPYTEAIDGHIWHWSGHRFEVVPKVGGVLEVGKGYWLHGTGTSSSSIAR